MKILVDTNRLVAALIKESTTRAILFDEKFEFITPEFTLSEFNKHKNEIQEKTKLTDKEFEILIALIFERITILPLSEYGLYINKCKNEIKDIDNVPFIAASIACDAQGIWTHDPHFKEQNKIKIFTNIDLLNIK